MRSFGIVCRLNKTGGIRLPGVLRGLCEVKLGETIEMYLEGDAVVMRKYPPTCIFCGCEGDLKEYKNKSYCCCCADELKKL